MSDILGSGEQPGYKMVLDEVRLVLGDVLQLDTGADRLDAETPLLGHIPEFDSMAVVAVVTALEEQFGIVIEDDDISAEVFATVGSLADLVAAKLS